jgi:transcriptional regulator with XRE-family HTH domain
MDSLDQLGSVGSMVRRWVDASGRTAPAVARIAGVSNSTLHRVLNGQVDPSLGTLSDIAVGCGLNLTCDAGTLADPAAAAAARQMLEAGYETSLPGVDQWVDRLTRAGGEHPVDIVRIAGVASSPLLRETTQLLSGTVTVGRLASAGDASEGEWALSGMAGFCLPGIWDPAPALTILWCEDSRLAGQLLADTGCRQVTLPAQASFALVEADPALFTDAFTHDRVKYVAPIQMLLDGFSIGGEVAELADAEARSW